MNNGLKIEELNKDNFESFFSLVKELANYEKLPLPDGAAKERLMKDGLSKNPKYFAFLGKSENRYVGYILFFKNYSRFLALPTLYLEDIYVQQEHRRKGIGQQLFNFYLAKAKTLGCGRAEWCVLNWNTPAISFYEKNDAKKLEWTFFRMTKEQISERLRKL